MAARSKQVTIRLEEDDYQKLKYLAEKSCRSVPRMARQMILADFAALEKLFGRLEPGWFLLLR